jgi:hypothetical protein
MEAETTNIEKSKEREINAEIEKISEINRKEQKEVKILEKENKIESDAISLYDLYNIDCRDENINNMKKSK